MPLDIRSLRSLVLLAAAAAVGAMAQVAGAATVTVGAFGDQGWRSDDTRDTTGADLVGLTSTHAGDPAVVPSAAHDTAIAQQIQFVAGPVGSTYGGAVSIDGTSSNSGKSNFSVISPVSGFDAAANLLSSFNATYEWYGQPKDAHARVQAGHPVHELGHVAGAIAKRLHGPALGRAGVGPSARPRAGLVRQRVEHRQR